MSNSDNSLKSNPWASYERSREWQDKLHREAANKALDIGDPGMVNANKYGIGWKELAVAAIAGLAAGGIYQSQQPTPPVPQQQATSQVDTRVEEVELRFYDAAGQLIDVPRWPGQPNKEP